MDKELQQQMDKVKIICRLIEDGQEYMREIMGYLPALNQTVNALLTASQEPNIPFMIEEQFVVQLLRDILYGIEQQDTVFLLDVLRYGLLELYSCCVNSFRVEENYE